MSPPVAHISAQCGSRKLTSGGELEKLDGNGNGNGHLY